MREVLAPFDGAILSLSDFDDIVFRDELVGSGLGVRPAHDCTTLDVFSPLSGTVIKVLPHAFIVMAGDVGVLVHIGIDTIGLHGDGFTCLIFAGSRELVVGAAVRSQGAIVQRHVYAGFLEKKRSLGIIRASRAPIKAAATRLCTEGTKRLPEACTTRRMTENTSTVWRRKLQHACCARMEKAWRNGRCFEQKSLMGAATGSIQRP